MIRLAILAAGLTIPTAQPLFIDAMEDANAWPAHGSDGVAATRSVTDHAIELQYDFARVSGYAFMRRTVDLTIPRNYEIRFRLRGTGGRNDIQLKLTDGDNVWWKVWRNFRPATDWQDVVVRPAGVGFAWGPATDKTLRHADGIELVVARNRDGGAGIIAIDDLQIVPLSGEPAAAATTADPNAALVALAKAAPRGTYPRAFIGEQPYWTLAGSDGGKISALIDEDAAIEPAKGSYSIAPIVFDRGERFDWARIWSTQTLVDRRLPIPSVRWTAPGFTLDTLLLADHAGRAAFAAYTLTNRTHVVRTLTLRLAIRPWQVNPLTQFLSQTGGASPISRIGRRANTLAIVQPQEEGDPPVTRALGFERLPIVTIATNRADLDYRLTLAPGQSTRLILTLGEPTLPFDRSYAETVAHWHQTLGRVAITVPPSKQVFADTLATNFAYILTSRAGAMLRPGTRSYNRAWIRDGAMLSDALLRMGRADVARSFADFYGSNQFANGKIPCCVDFRGADPVPENDSHGEYIFLVGELFRFTHDRAALARDWPHVLAAAHYMDALRQSERTAANQSPDRRMLYGLMPPSISHEGYSTKPQYSLWDDFWALRGYRDAADIAAVLSKPQADALAASRDEFSSDLHAAILAARDYWRIAFIPGATSLGDFDATSTTIALDPGNEQSRLDPDMLRATFDRYWSEFQARASGSKTWEDYTPYETRAIGSFVRLGWRNRIDPLLAFFLAGRRPSGWNQWAEVVGRVPRKPRFIGDMPHAWVASDFVRGALDMFAWERRDDAALVLGGGLSSDWLAGQGSAIRNLATPYGSLDFGIRGDERRFTATIAGTARPPGGFVLAWPFAGQPPVARVNGKPTTWAGRELRLASSGSPYTIEIGR